VTVTNTGDREGDEVVIVYVHDLYASVTRPVKEVAAFSRLTLTRGETQTVTLVIDAKRLALHDREMNYVIEPGEFEVYVGDQIARFAVV
jgi:beta-glucosidase